MTFICMNNKLTVLSQGKSRVQMQQSEITRLQKHWSLPVLHMLTVGFLTLSVGAACAQSPFSVRFSPGPPANRALEADLPGITDRGSPFLFPPVFRGEVRVRPLFIGMGGEVENRETGARLDVRSDLGYEDRGTIVEGMVRAQFSRVSLRVHKDMYLRTLEGTVSRLDWPEVRLGMDLDLADSYRLRFGLNMDWYMDSPRFSLGSSQIGNFAVDWPRPVTVGIHARFNTPNFGAMSGSFESRFRTSLLTEVRMHEVDLAAGLTTPQTVIGTVGLRAGWRYTSMEYSIPRWQMDLRWSSVFLELIHNY